MKSAAVLLLVTGLAGAWTDPRIHGHGAGRVGPAWEEVTPTDTGKPPVTRPGPR